MNLLAKEPGTKPEKEEWLEREFPLLVEYAEREYPGDEDRQVSELRSRVIRHWRVQVRSPRTAHPRAWTAADQRLHRGKQAAEALLEELLR